MALGTLGDSEFIGNRHGTKALDVIALHGWGRSGTDFSTVLKDTQGLAVHLPGFGSAQAPPEAWTTADYADHLAAALAGHDPVVVVGHSFGGRVALRLAARHPHQVAALVLTGVPLVRRSASAGQPLPFRLARFARKRGLLSETRMEAFRQRYGSSDYRTAQGVMRQILVSAIAETHWDDIARITQPVTLVWGELDEPAPLAGAEKAREVFPNATLRVVPGASHLLEGILEEELASALRLALLTKGH